MSLTMAILMLIGMWVSVAAAMLWGVMRIVRRHHPHHQAPPKAARRLRRHINAH
ncbi:MAG TPA: hypothetical protein VJS90_20255 [Pseudomonas sp.]|uniref:hypothetical protein n=1 Tax=Pseudomonas sp. TaxID=306 RepID=UPI002B47AA39|nr:hypothetical protein [Pseudomonas sp.]HKS15369.1 hypothetical protein [Pseudomonas sp.]